MAIQDRMFAQDGSLFYPAFPGDPFYDDFITGEGVVLPPGQFPGGGPTALAEFFADHMLVNGTIWPKMEVEPRNYRLRFLNGCDSRFLVTQFFEVPAGSTDFSNVVRQLSFTVIGSDQGLASSPTTVDTLVRTYGAAVPRPAGYVENARKDMVTALPGQITRIKATFDKPGRGWPSPPAPRLTSRPTEQRAVQESRSVHAMETLDEMLVWHRVFDLANRYASCIDTRDWTGLRACFTDPVQVDFSTFTHRPAPPDPIPAEDWMGAIRGTISGFVSTQHLIGNHAITVDGPDRAHYHAYIQAQHWMSSDRWYLIGGWYRNEARLVDGAWRLASVTLDQQWDAGDRGLLREATAIARERGAD